MMTRILTIAGCIFTLITLSVAEIDIKYYEALAGQVQESEDILQLSISQASALMTNENIYTGICASRRVGAIGGLEALNLLVTTFCQTPYCNTNMMEALPNAMKMDIIRVIGKLGTPGAKQALLTIAERYWSRGPQTNAYCQYDSEYATVMAMASHELERWASDDDVYMYSKNVCSEPELKRRLASNQRCYIIKLYELGDMMRKGTTNRIDIVTNVAARLCELRGNPASEDDEQYAFVLMIANLPADVKSSIYKRAERGVHETNDKFMKCALKAKQEGKWTEQLRKEKQQIDKTIKQHRLCMQYCDTNVPVTVLQSCKQLD